MEAEQYDRALELFTPLAEAGSGDASYQLAVIFDQGLGTPQDYTAAFGWYKRAIQQSTQHRAEAEDRISRLRAKLPATALVKAEYAASVERLELDDEYGCVSFSGETFDPHDVLSFRADATVDQMVTDIVYYSGLRRNFRVQQGNVPNAAAMVRGSERFLVYNPNFINEVADATGNSWGPYSVMAHEIGHHLQGHTIQPGGSRPDIELEADEFSGFVVAHMGGKLEEAQAAMSVFGSRSGSATHPARDQRLSAIKSGWDRARSMGAAQRRSEIPPPLTSPPPLPDPGPREPAEYPMPSPYPVPQRRIARICQTNFGACPMMTPVAVGMSCYCMTQAGTFPGIAR